MPSPSAVAAAANDLRSNGMGHTPTSSRCAVVIGDEAGQVAVEVECGNEVANAFRGVKAAIHQNHGLPTASRHSIELHFQTTRDQLSKTQPDMFE